MKLLRSIVVLSGTSAMCSVAHGNSTPVTRGTVQGGTVVPVATADVAVVREKLHVEITPTEQRNVVSMVTVSAEYVLRHEGTEPIELEVGFPIAGQFMNSFNFYGKAPEVPGLGYEVTLDDVKLDATEEALPLPPTARTGGYDGWHQPRNRDEAKVESERLTAAFTRWVAADRELQALLEGYSRIAPSHEQYHHRKGAFDRAVEAAFSASDRAHAVSQYLHDPKNRYAVADLIRHLDSRIKWRNPETYDDATLDSYRRIIEQRLAEHPQIKGLHDSLAEQLEIQRLAREFIAQRVQPHLMARYELSDFALRRMVSYLENAYNPHRHGWSLVDQPPKFDPPAQTLPKDPPDLWLVSQIDPEFEALRLSRIAEADAVLERYGFDATFLSPLTGKGYWKRVGWRDDSTWDILGFEPPTDTDPEFAGRFVTDDRVTHVTSPRTEARLIRFTVPMQPGQVRTLRVKYSALVEVDDSRWHQAEGIEHFRYILTTARNWKSFGPIDLTVTLPSQPMVVIDPPPQEQRDLGDGRIQYSARIVNPDRNLRVAFLSGPGPGPGQSYLFNMVKPDHLEDLRKLEAAVEHPQAKQVLQALMKAVETKRGS